MLDRKQLETIKEKKYINFEEYLLLESHLYEINDIIEKNEYIDIDIYNNLSKDLEEITKILEKNLKNFRKSKLNILK